MKTMRIGYFADGPWAHLTLVKLLSDETLEVVFVCARDDVPDPVLRSKSAEKSLKFITHPNINSKEFLEQMRAFDCDLHVSMSFNQIFRHELIQLPPLKTINCHAGKLPFYRGRNILNWALINDEKEFGITVHYVDEGIDTGDIILQRCFPITDDDNYSTLLKSAYEGCASTLYDAIKVVQSNNVKPIVQTKIHPLGFYCSARSEGDEQLDWNQKSRDIFNFVRAICRPGPEARTFLGDKEIKINRVQYLPDAPVYKGVVGAVVGLDNNSFFVKTSDSYIKVTEYSGCSRPRMGDRLR
ncbi:MAG: formyl transferase [Desulfobulbaceae bacterium]|nr:MAG: formyl transferase [Desulfobulbaceae bacterium]